MSKTLYEKKGGRYRPVIEKDVWSGDSWGKGCHLVICEPGIRSIRFKIEPNEAPILAAIHIAASEIADMIQKASSLSLKTANPLTKEQIEAWDNLQNSFGESKFSLSWPSANDIALKFLNTLKDRSLVDNK